MTTCPNSRKDLPITRNDVDENRWWKCGFCGTALRVSPENTALRPRVWVPPHTWDDEETWAPGAG